MFTCEKHKITVSGNECPICRADAEKEKDAHCIQCVDRGLSANSLICASCLAKPERPNFRKV